MEKLDVLKQEVEKLAKSISKSSKFIKGTPVILKRKCGQKGCKCVKGEKHSSLYLSKSVKGKTAMTYIPKKYEQEIYSGVEKYKTIIKKIEKISEINLEILKLKKELKKNKK